MNNQTELTKTYTIPPKKALIIGVGAFAAVLGIVGLVAFLILTSGPKIVYQPATACDLLTFDEAKQLLGDKTIISSATVPTISGDTAISKCGYTDANPVIDDVIVAAITVRSGINDQGSEKNKSEFNASMKGDNIQTVTNLGDRAYFNVKLGQLNILKDHEWIILSYGVGSAPEANTLEKAVELAKAVL